ncbi:mRNA-decapping enzyme 1B-like [Argonauta hians]
MSSNSSVGHTTNGASVSGGSGAGPVNLANPLALLPFGAEGRMNLAALQQKDPYITAIVDTAKQVALYLFSSKENEWERTAIEGTLFVYRRSASPDNGFMILNRLGPNNLVQPITKDLEFQLHDPFLLYRTSKAICGIWFYDKDECARVGQLMNGLVQLAITNHHAKTQGSTRQRRASESDSLDERSASDAKKETPTAAPAVASATSASSSSATAAVAAAAAASSHVVPAPTAPMPANRPVGILQLLTKAQHEYDKSKDVKKKPEPVTLTDNPGRGSTTSLIRPTPLCVANSSSAAGQHNSNHVSSMSGRGAPSSSLSSSSSSQICLEKLFSSNDVGRNSVRVANPSPLSNNIVPNRDLNDPSSNAMPSIMKQLGSAVPLVEDIERQQRGEPVPSRSHALSSPNVVTPAQAQDMNNGADMLRSIYQNSSGLAAHHNPNMLAFQQQQHHHQQQPHVGPTPSVLPTSFASSDQGLPLPVPLPVPQSPKQAVSNFNSNANMCSLPPMLLSDAAHNLHSPVRSTSQSNASIQACSDSMANLLVSRLDQHQHHQSTNSSFLHHNNSTTTTNAATITGAQGLLTPADLEPHPSGSHISSSSTSSSVTGSSSLDVLLSPMAFVTTPHQAKAGAATAAAVAAATASTQSNINTNTTITTTNNNINNISAAAITITPTTTNTNNNHNNSSNYNNLGQSTDASSHVASLVPLTKDQLQQAMLYLLKNDAGFLSKIHEAYLSTLNPDMPPSNM